MNIINKIIIKSLGLAMSLYQEISLIITDIKKVSIKGIIVNVPIFIRTVIMV